MCRTELRDPISENHTPYGEEYFMRLGRAAEKSWLPVRQFRKRKNAFGNERRVDFVSSMQM
jgi:hypothetical protein